MGYTLVKSFERGIDTRKLIDTTEPGTLLDAVNCHITLGGELEKRAAFFVKDTLPDTTIGLWVTEGRVYHTWGDAPMPGPAGLPAGTMYHPVPDPDGSPLLRVLSVEEFTSLLYVIVEYEDGHIYHWYNDQLLTYPDTPAIPGGGPPPASSPDNSPHATVEFRRIDMGLDPIPDITISYIYLRAAGATTYDWGVNAWLILPQVAMAGTFPLANLLVPSPSLDIVIGAAVMNAINAFVPPVVDPAPVTVAAQASATTGEVTFWIEDADDTYNGWKIEVAFDGLCELYPSPSTPATLAITSFTLNGGVEPPPTGPGSPAVPGAPMTKGTFARAHSTRMFVVQDSKLNFAAPKAPDNWLDSAGAGFIEHSMETSRKPILKSLAEYGGDLAVFGTRHIFVWNMGVTRATDTKQQTLHGTGTFAPHSVVPYGQSDVMYLDISGIRSLRARDSSEQAFAADIGTLIDDLVRTKIDSLTVDQKNHNIWGVVEPRTGRLWMALYDKIFVLSMYPTSRISAWTIYDATEAPVDYMVSSDESVYWRSGNDIILYGDESGVVYDDTEALARIPYIDAGKPASMKNWTGIDLALFGTWAVRASFDPTVPAALDLVANLTKSTYAQQKIAMNGESPAVSLELRSMYVGPARVGNAALHFTDSTAD